MAVQIQVYDQLVQLMSDGTMDMNGDTFKMMLLNNSHTFTAGNTLKSQIVANEISGVNGYTTGGVALTTVTYNQVSGTVTWDSDSPTWTASGGAITAYHGVIYNDTTTSPLDALCVSINFDGVQTAGDGTDFVVAPHASNGWMSGSIADA